MANKKNTPVTSQNPAERVDAAGAVTPVKQRARKVRQAAEMLVLEPRMMFDGAALSTAELVFEKQKNDGPVVDVVSEKSAPQIDHESVQQA